MQIADSALILDVNDERRLLQLLQLHDDLDADQMPQLNGDREEEEEGKRSK